MSQSLPPVPNAGRARTSKSPSIEDLEGNCVSLITFSRALDRPGADQCL